jgi:tetratricopeptide (TPR) repeat protein
MRPTTEKPPPESDWIDDSLRKQHRIAASSSKTGSAEATGSSIAVTGTVIGDINLFTGVPVNTRYREQVRRIAPRELVERDAELGELKEFCTAAEPASSYMWWRADAWAGKSALMSWFVLNPPPGIRIVSFFITSRLASQNDRTAFIENVLEQLATLLGAAIPEYLTDATREAHLLGMLSDAAQASQTRSERLVLVVDGLDEDRRVGTDSRSYSIAALLPDGPPADMRVIVAGRPNPPVPPDVREDHPLRHGAIVRPLAASRFAAVVRNDMEAELKQLLRGSEIDQDLLGLLTAARGGLSGSDLAKLAGKPAWQVDDELRAVTGRSFKTWSSYWRPGIWPDVYVLGHEELQDTARQYLGQARLGVYGKRLRSWADTYRERGWPPDTPEYLLRDYYQMLKQDGDLRLMIACATDRRRHDRMLELSGGDNAALEEIIAAQDILVRRPEPDLISMARLAVLRDYLRGRNAMVPVELPAVWASLGQIRRAEALARSIAQVGRRDASLVELVKAVTATGDLHQAEILAEAITRRDQRARATMVLLRARAMAGDSQAAETLLESLPSGGQQMLGLTILALAEAEAGHPGQAQGFIERARAGLSSAVNPRRRGEALAALAEAEAAIGDAGQARSLLDEAIAVARSISQPSWRAGVLAALVTASARVEGRDQAGTLIDEAETLIQSIRDAVSRTGALATLARAVGSLGDMTRAQALVDAAARLARTIAKPTRQAGAWGIVLRTATAIGVARARDLYEEAEAIIGSVGNDESRATALVILAQDAATTGHLERARRLASQAEELARSVADPEGRGADLAALVKAMAAAGILAHAEEIVLAIPRSSRPWVEAMVSIAKAAAMVGDVDRAAAIVGSLDNPSQQAGALAALVQDAALAGDLRQAEELARSISRPDPRAKALISLANGAGAAGDLDRAETIVGLIPSERHQAAAFAALTEVAAAVGNRGRATHFAQQTWTLAGIITRPDWREEAFVIAAKAMAAAGHLAQAREIAQTIVAPGPKAAAQAAIVKAIAATGDTPGAINAAVSIQDRYWRAISQLSIVATCTAVGDTDHAYSIAEEIRAETGRIPDLSQRESILVSLVETLGTIGRPAEAEAMIAEITIPHRRAEAFVALANMVEPARALTLIAHAIHAHHWTTSLTTLTRIQPALLEVFADEVMSLAERKRETTVS